MYNNGIYIFFEKEKGGIFINIFNSKEYQEYKQELEKYFIKENFSKKVKHIEFNGYILDISSYKTKEGCWDFTRGTVTKDNKVIADVKRNYHAFLYFFLHHSNGNDYLICGEDYQGYTIVNLTAGITNTFIPKEWMNGIGFCITDIHDYYEDDDELKIEGCIWGGPFKYIYYDFSNPDILPLPILDSRYVDDDIMDKEDEEDEEDEEM